MIAVYNEIERYPAAWLRNLIAAGHAIVPQVAAAFVRAVMS